jgi:hypothetical protein
MASFDDYAGKYRTIRMERRDGILQMTFHTDGGPLQWGLLPHGEFPQAFRDVGGDPENKVVILTGTGDTYSGLARDHPASALRPRGGPGTGRPASSELAMCCPRELAMGDRERAGVTGTCHPIRGHRRPRMLNYAASRR